MAFSENDYIIISRHLRSEMREHFPDIFEALGKQNTDLTARESLVRYLRNVIHLITSQSSNSYESVLELLNSYVSNYEHDGITGIRVEFSEEDQRLYGRHGIELNELPDRKELTSRLLKVLNDIADEPQEFGENNDITRDN